jgi:class 3 adenylate cyclase
VASKRTAAKVGRVETRKIAAILAADVVGYSRLAGADQHRTLARLRALLSDLIDPTIAVHHGRVVERTGDGAPGEFRSVVDAVRCAIEVQNGMLERNAGLSPAAHRVPNRDPFGRCRRRERRATASSSRDWKASQNPAGSVVLKTLIDK